MPVFFPSHRGSVLAVTLVTSVMMVLGPRAAAEEPTPAPAPSPGGQVERPRLLKPVQPKYPPEAWDADIEGDVVLLLMVGVDGMVTEAEVVSTPGHGMEIAALVATKAMVFSPAVIDGEAVTVRIRYTFRFRKPEKGSLAQPPERAPEGWVEDDKRPKGTLSAFVFQRGTGRPLKGAEVYLLDLDTAALTDENGHFQRSVTPGGYALTIRVPGHHTFETLERIEAGQTVVNKYYLEPRRDQRYRTIVWGSEGKAAVGRTTLADAEIYEVPGTMGDPIRVVMLMPGVTTSVSGVGYPIVRGALPADTHYEVDGINVPMLYHLMLGNSVVNPRYTQGITFQPGGYGAEHGRYPGALIQAGSTSKPTERITAGDLSIIQGSLFHAQPISDNLQVMAGGRIGTLGLIIEALASDAVFQYWDYQTKLFWQPTERDALQFMVFGAGNAVGEDPANGPRSVVNLGFHRADIRWRRSLKRGWFRLDLEAGQEGFKPPSQPTAEPDDVEPGREDSSPEEIEEDAMNAEYRYLALRGRGAWTPVDDLEFRLGGGTWLQDFDFDLRDDNIHSAKDGLTAGAWLEAEWSPGPWTLVPGVRLDHYRWGLEDGIRKTSVDPRFAVGYKINSWLSARAAAGVYHGPPRFTLVAGPIVIGPVPGMMGSGLNRGLNHSYQVTGGLEATLPWRFQARLQGFHNWVHTSFDFSLMGAQLEAPDPADWKDEWDEDEETEGEGDDFDMDSLATNGRSYGIEAMLRRRLGDNVFGWLTWSFSRSERDIKNVGTLPFLFDQTHVLNGVVSWEVGRAWTLGTTFHFHTGRPYTPESLGPCSGEGTTLDFGDAQACWGPPLSARLPSFWRLDLRVQKREMFDTWYFDFYVDVFNITFNQEVIGYEMDDLGRVVPVKFPIFVPMLGLRGQF